MYTKDAWVYTVSFDDGRVIAPSQDSKRRREDIESEGFEECFRLLEKKLRNTYW
jgi:hypothetical protein